MAYRVEIESILMTTDGFGDEAEETVQIEFNLVCDSQNSRWREVKGNITLETPLIHAASPTKLASVVNRSYKKVADILETWADDAEKRYRPVRRKKPRPKPA